MGNPYYLKEGVSDITYQKFTMQLLRKSLKDSHHMTIQFSHGSVNGKKTTQPEKASQMRWDTAAMKNIRIIS